MTGLVDVVRNRVSEQCLVEECDKNDCSVSLNGTPQPHLVIDFDGPNSPVGQSQRRCDYLFIADGRSNRSWVVPMELKNSEMKVSKVVGQLQAGARVAQKLVSSSGAISFRPVAVVREIHKDAREKLRKRNGEVSFRGGRERIRVLICGEPLTKALDA